MIQTLAIIGAGNGGKAAAADLALRGKRVRLFEFPDYAAALASLRNTRRLTATGAVRGCAVLERVTTTLAAAVRGADAILVCTQALAHERAARALAPLVAPGQIVILNPGSTGGALQFARVFREAGLARMPLLVEFSTLTYGCRAAGARVEIALRVRRVIYGTLPAQPPPEAGPELEALFPGLVRGRHVLEAGLNNANPVIHPPIALLNGARFENEGARVFFYRDGVSPAVARLIEQLDGERMALLKALGCPAQPDPVTSVQQGYAASAEYFACYARGPGFVKFRAPNTLNHRYFHEDIGLGLVLYCSLGARFGVPTPTAEAFVRMGSAISNVDYMARGARTLNSLGLGGLSRAAIARYLDTGRFPGRRASAPGGR